MQTLIYNQDAMTATLFEGHYKSGVELFNFENVISVKPVGPCYEVGVPTYAGARNATPIFRAPIDGTNLLIYNKFNPDPKKG